jgi:hypothetical protein
MMQVAMYQSRRNNESACLRSRPTFDLEAGEAEGAQVICAQVICAVRPRVAAAVGWRQRPTDPGDPARRTQLALVFAEALDEAAFGVAPAPSRGSHARLVVEFWPICQPG